MFAACPRCATACDGVCKRSAALGPVTQEASRRSAHCRRNAQAHCSATAYGGYGAATSLPREGRKSARSLQQAHAAPVESPTIQRTSAKIQQLIGALTSIALSSSAATSHRVHCYAVASCAVQVQKNYGLLHIALSQENLVRRTHAARHVIPCNCARAAGQKASDRVHPQSHSSVACR